MQDQTGSTLSAKPVTFAHTLHSDLEPREPVAYPHAPARPSKAAQVQVLSAPEDAESLHLFERRRSASRHCEGRTAQVYHFLTESEPFSEYHGGAISRWVANVVSADRNATVIAPSADESWHVDGHVEVLSSLSSYRKLMARGGWCLPWSLRRAALRSIFADALGELQEGDTVWVHNRPEYAAAIEPLVRERGARLVLHLHNSHLVEWSETIVSSFRADQYVFCSHFLEQQALAKFPDLQHTAVLRNGADEHLFHPRLQPRAPGRAPVILFAGRLVADKGLHLFVQAMRELHYKGVKVTGRVVGSVGFGSSETSNYVEQLRLTAPSNVAFLPYCTGTELAALFRSASAFCLPAVWEEPLGMAVIEAMASGLPVVASDSGGIPETLAEGGGLLVARNNLPQLTAALKQIATDAELRERLSREAYASFTRNFTWERVRQQYQHLLQTHGHFASRGAQAS